ncbi:MAG: glutaredoxin domain-containing protein [Cyanobacteria bacterium J06635_15]
MTHKIQIFTKPNCRFCEIAKQTLRKSGFAYSEHDIATSKRAANLSVYLSGVVTVPQIFIGGIHVNGSSDLVALAAAERLVPLTAGVTRAISQDDLSDADIAAGAEDLILNALIPESDGTHSDDPEEWAILHFYKAFFGFWPNCFYFMHHWPEAYKLFVYAHNIGAIGGGRNIVGEAVMMAVGFATSNAHGCNYCQVHMTAAGGKNSLGMPKLIEAARLGKAPVTAPIGPFEVALSDLAAAATTNTVTVKQLSHVKSLTNKARVSKAGADANIMGTAMIASAFGFLNTFNDLTGVQVEAEWAEQAKAHAGIEAGRHGVSTDRTSTNLNHDLPQNGPSIEEMIAQYEGIVAGTGGTEAYAICELGLVPAWMMLWPEHLRARHVLFYAEIMQPRDHSPIASELKHLMARVAAVSKGHDYLAAVEGWLAYRASEKTLVAVERVRHCFAVAKGQEVARSLFTQAEQAALTLAWLSAQTPLTTPRRFIQSTLDAFSPVELVHLITVCSMAGLIQRFVAIAKPQIEPEVKDFLASNGLVTDTLAIRYPLIGKHLER